MKRTITTILACILIAALCAGCNLGTQPNPSASPSRAPGVSPSGGAGSTGMPMNSADPAGSGTPQTSEDPTGGVGMGMDETMNDTEAARAVEEAVDKLSEVESSTALVVDGVAIVGVKFDSQYQAGMTARVTQMVEQAVKSADESITQVHVTHDEGHLTKMGELASRVGEDIKTDFDDIVDDIREMI